MEMTSVYCTVNKCVTCSGASLYPNNSLHFVFCFNFLSDRHIHIQALNQSILGLCLVHASFFYTWLFSTGRQRLELDKRRKTQRHKQTDTQANMHGNRQTYTDIQADRVRQTP